MNVIKKKQYVSICNMIVNFKTTGLITELNWSLLELSALNKIWCTAKGKRTAWTDYTNKLCELGLKNASVFQYWPFQYWEHNQLHLYRTSHILLCAVSIDQGVYWINIFVVESTFGCEKWTTMGNSCTHLKWLWSGDYVIIVTGLYFGQIYWIQPCLSQPDINACFS